MQRGTFRYDQLLTQFSVGLGQGDMVIERVLGVIPVDNQSDKYPVYGPENLTPIEDLRAPGSEAKEASWTVSDGSYYCDGHALKDFVPREKQRAGTPSIDLIQNSLITLTDRINLNQEIAGVAAIVAGMSTYYGAQTATPWDNDSYDPIDIIDTQATAIALRVGKMPNVLVVSKPVWDAIKRNGNVIGRITGAPSLESAKVVPQAVAALLDLEEVIVATGVKNSAIEGQPASNAWVWGEYALLAVRPRLMGQRIVALGGTFHWRAALEALSGQAGQVAGSQLVQRYWVQERNADCVEIHKHYDVKIIAQAAGYLFTDCLT
jgi:hypothetical protein